jgi:hypothetical protein
MTKAVARAFCSLFFLYFLFAKQAVVGLDMRNPKKFVLIDDA